MFKKLSQPFLLIFTILKLWKLNAIVYFYQFVLFSEGSSMELSSEILSRAFNIMANARHMNIFIGRVRNTWNALWHQWCRCVTLRVSILVIHDTHLRIKLHGSALCHILRTTISWCTCSKLKWRRSLYLSFYTSYRLRKTRACCGCWISLRSHFIQINYFSFLQL